MSYTLKDEQKYWSNPYERHPGSYDMEGLSKGTVTDENVNNSLKPIDRKDANVEAEKDEIVFTNMGQLLKVRGKRHSGGGTPLRLEEDSFVVSDNKKLTINKEDAELLKLKLGGNIKKNTPAKTLERVVDLKHHNKMIAILNNPKSDDIAINSARLMLEKNQEKINKITYLQEAYKGFPQGLPDYVDNVEAEPENLEYMEKQFKDGGLFKAQDGVYARSLQQLEKMGAKRVNPADTLRYGPDFKRWNFDGGRAFQQLVPTSSVKQNTNTIKTDNNFYSPFNQKRMKALFEQGLTPEQIVDRKDFSKAFLPDLQKAYKPKLTYVPSGENNSKNTSTPTVSTPSTVANTGFVPTELPLPKPDFSKKSWVNAKNLGLGVDAEKDIKDPVTQYDNNVGRSFEQNASLFNDFYNALSSRKLNPMRIQQEYTPLELERINKQPFVNAVNNQVYQANRVQQGYTPMQARAMQSQNLGQGLDKIAEVEGNIYNQNLQIGNTEAQINNQGFNAVNNINRQLDADYYDKFITTEANFDNTKQIGRNMAMQKWLSQEMDNEDLEYRLNSAQALGEVWVDPSTNLPVKGISDEDARKNGYVKKAAAPMIFNPYTRKVEHSGIKVNFDSLPAGTRGDDVTRLPLILESLLERLKNRPESVQAAAVSGLMRNFSRQPSLTPTIQNFSRNR
jgi:hypothetical protein